MMDSRGPVEPKCIASRAQGKICSENNGHGLYCSLDFRLLTSAEANEHEHSIIDRQQVDFVVPGNTF